MFDDHRDVLLAPVISEKSYGLLDDNKYTFDVHPDANKTQIKIAVQKVFGVKVTSVNTLNRQGKRKRTRNGFGQRKSVKRAIVTLRAGDRIDVFGHEIGARQRLLRDIDEQRLRALQECLGAIRPAAALKIPFHRLDAVAMANAGVGKQAR